jgi:hypothetical protein
MEGQTAVSWDGRPTAHFGIPNTTNHQNKKKKKKLAKPSPKKTSKATWDYYSNNSIIW